MLTVWEVALLVRPNNFGSRIISSEHGSSKSSSKCAILIQSRYRIYICMRIVCNSNIEGLRWSRNPTCLSGCRIRKPDSTIVINIVFVQLDMHMHMEYVHMHRSSSTPTARFNWKYFDLDICG